MQNNNNNSRKLLNSKKDSLPAAEVQNNANSYRIKKSATSIKRSNSNNKNHNSANNSSNNSNNNNINTINSTKNGCSYNGKTTAANNLQTKSYKSNGYSKQIAAIATATTTTATPATTGKTTTATSTTGTTTTSEIATTATETVITTLAIPQNAGIQTAENGIAVKTRTPAGSTKSGQGGQGSGGGAGGGNNMKSKIILSETFYSKQIDTLSSPSSSSSQQQQHKQSQNQSLSNKARHHSFNGHATGSTTPADKGAGVGGLGMVVGGACEAVGTVISTHKTKKSLTTPTTVETTTTLALIQQTTLTTSTTASSTKIKPTTSLSLSASNGNGSTSNYNGSGTNSNNNSNTNSKQNFQIPSDILDDLASRFIINVPDMELSNLIRICFQIELAHWFYLDFFCTGNDEEAKTLQPVGMKYFATQLFQHIPFLSEHLPNIDSVLEDWKNYKLAVPTFGAILISEDLQYCLLVQSYFAKSSWGFPKGKINETEDPEHCATREVFEETGYDITGLLVPKDYIEAVINDQYTRLYIVCNVSLDTVFEPRTRNEIRCCGWFSIDSLPNNKNDAISKAKLGQNANSFFMILPFVKRLKKWVNEKRLKMGINVDSNNGATGGSGALVILGSSSNTNNGNNKTNDRRKYSTNGCQNNATNVNGAILKSPSLGYVGGDTHFNNSHRSNALTNTNSSKKNRQQQKTLNGNNNNNNCSNNTNTNNNGKSNNVAGCFVLSEIEANAFIAVGANAVAASAAANARSKRQRHKSMGDLDNMNAFNNYKNTNSCNKNIYINGNNSNNIKRNLVQKMNIVTSNENHHNNDNATHTGSSSRRQLFHSQSQNDGVISDSGGIDQITTSSFSLIRQERQQQQVQPQQQQQQLQMKYVQQKSKPDMIQYFAESVTISDEQTRKHIRQRAKSQSEKAVTQQQQFQLQTINDCYFSNNNKNNNNNNNNNSNSNNNNNGATTTSRPNLQRQSSLNSTKSTILKATTSTLTTTTAAVAISSIMNTADNRIVDKAENVEKSNADCVVAGGEIMIYDERKLLGQQQIQHQQQQQQQRQRRYTTTTAPTLTGNDLIAWSAARLQQINKTNVNANVNAMATTKTTTMCDQTHIAKSVVEASAIETRLIQEQKLMRQLEEVKQQKQDMILPFMLQQNTEKSQQQQQVSLNSPQPNQQLQPQRHALQHSASSPGLATWKNFSFTKNLISNVFL